MEPSDFAFLFLTHLYEVDAVCEARVTDTVSPYIPDLEALIVQKNYAPI